MLATFRNKYLSLSLCLIIGIIFANSQTANATDEPPSINIEDFENPPSLNITIPDDPNPPPPADDQDQDDDNPSPPAENNIEISDVQVEPDEFNPAISSVKISFKLSGDAFMNIRIEDKEGQTVIKLSDNKKMEEGKNFVIWQGTINNQISGPIVKNGTYKYKMTASSISSGEIEDTAQGEITVNYSESPPDDDTPGTSDFPDNNNEPDNDDPNAISVLHNEFDADTADTGPSTYIYLIFPLIGYFIYKIKFSA